MHPSTGQLNSLIASLPRLWPADGIVITLNLIVESDSGRFQTADPVLRQHFTRFFPAIHTSPEFAEY
jgi:hypothetical protein